MALNPASKKLLKRLAQGGAELDGEVWKSCRQVIDVPYEALRVLLSRGFAVQSLTLTEAGHRLVRQSERDDERGLDPVTADAMTEADLFGKSA